MKIGILGGTFNPVHAGHLIMAEGVYETLKLDRIIFVPTNLPPHKSVRDIATAIDRLKMLNLATKGNPHFSVSDTEIKREGKSYTIDTVREFKKKFKNSELYFIIGSDYRKGLREWKDVREIQKSVKFVVVNRPGYSLNVCNRDALNLHLKTINLSGYEIRERIREEQSIRYLVPLDVMKYIFNRGLYKK